MKEKVTEKQLKEPDFLQIAFWKIVDYLSKNKTKVITVAAVTGSLIIGGLGWFIYSHVYESRANELFLTAYEQDIKVNNQGVEEAIKAYTHVTVSYPRSKAARWSYFRLGSLYYEKNAYDEAIAAYQAFLNSKLKERVFIYLANSSLGYCFEAKGELARAVTFFEEAVKNSIGDNFTVLGYRNIARIYEELKNKEKSLEHLKKALAISKDPSTQLLIKRKIAELS